MRNENNKFSFSRELRFLWKLLIQRKKIIFSILGVMIIIALCNTVLPYVSATIIDDGMLSGNVSIIIIYAAIFFLISTMISVGHILIERLRIKGYNQLQTRLKGMMINKLFFIRLDYFGNQSVTSIYQQMEDDIDAISGCFSEEFIFSLAKVIICLFLIPVLFTISWKLALVSLVAIPVFHLKTIILARIGYKYSKENIETNKVFSQWVSEYVSGIQIARCYIPFQHILSTYMQQQSKVVTARSNTMMYQEKMIRIDSILMDLLTFILYSVGAFSITRNELTIGQFISFQTYSFTLIGIVSDFLNVFAGYTLIKPSIERYQDFLETSEENRGSIGEINIKPNIELRNVSFHYETGKEVIRNLSLNIPYGKHFGLKGGNGVGKTTLINIILRFFAPTEGEIRMNGRSIDDYDITAYRSQFAYVPQKPFLFCDSIRDNICMFRDVDAQTLHDAIQRVGLSKLVKEKTLDYSVGQNGCELSGGQCQKIILARALLSQAPILLLDEPENNLDSDAKAILLNLITHEYANKTVIMISHNDDFLSHMNSICTLGEDS